MLPPESWITIAIFVINLIFFLIMSFVSPYFEVITAEGMGKIFNVMWLVLIIIIAGLIFTFNAQCLLTGNCRALSWTIVAILIVVTGLLMAWFIYHTILYKAPAPAPAVVQEEAKKI